MLCNEPWTLRPWEVSQLSPWEVADAYLCRRDRDGRVELEGDGERPETLFQRFSRRWAGYGLRADLTRRLWKDLGGD